MSALPAEADMLIVGINVCYVPLADIAAAMELVSFVPEADLPAKKPIGQPVMLSLRASMKG